LTRRVSTRLGLTAESATELGKWPRPQEMLPTDL
jgi:hypothetical protein